MPSKRNFDPDKQHRRSIRLKGYDYSTKGLYFITLSCKDRLSLFGQVEEGVMKLNDLGKIVENEWLKTPEIRSYLVLHEYVIMPDHFHAILEILYSSIETGPLNESVSFKSPKHTLGSIVRGFKSASAAKIRTYLNEHAKNTDVFGRVVEDDRFVGDDRIVGANSYSPLPSLPEQQNPSPLPDPLQPDNCIVGNEHIAGANRIVEDDRIVGANSYSPLPSLPEQQNPSPLPDPLQPDNCIVGNEHIAGANRIVEDDRFVGANSYSPLPSLLEQQNPSPLPDPLQPDNCIVGEEHIVGDDRVAGANRIVGDDRIVGANSYSPLPSLQPLPIIDSIPTKIWHRNYFEKIIWDEESYHKLSDYIRKNPERWWLKKQARNE